MTRVRVTTFEQDPKGGVGSGHGTWLGPHGTPPLVDLRATRPRAGTRAARSGRCAPSDGATRSRSPRRGLRPRGCRSPGSPRWSRRTGPRVVSTLPPRTAPPWTPRTGASTSPMTRLPLASSGSTHRSMSDSSVGLSGWASLTTNIMYFMAESFRATAVECHPRLDVARPRPTSTLPAKYFHRETRMPLLPRKCGVALREGQ